MKPDPSEGFLQQTLLRYEKVLLRYAFNLVGNREQARDAVQDTFLELVRADQRRIAPRLAAWLYTVCRNRAIDCLRKEARHMSLPAHEAQDLLLETAPPPDQVLEQRQNRHQVMQLITSLPTNQREVVQLKFQEGMSYKEISAITGHSVTNVGFLLHTALTRLRRDLGPQAQKEGGVS